MKSELDRIVWTDFEAAPDGDPTDIPKAIDLLLRSDGDGDMAENLVEVAVCDQARPYSVALPTIDVVLLVLAVSRSSSARTHALAMLDNFGFTNAESPFPADNDHGLDAEIQRRLMAGFWLYWSLLADPRPEVRSRALGMLVLTDPDRRRIGRLMDEMEQADNSREVQRFIGYTRSSHWWRRWQGESDVDRQPDRHRVA